MKAIKSYALITVVSVVNSLIFNAFYLPNDITCGGLTGIAQILNFYVPKLPIGTMVLVFNLPLFLMGFRLLGRGFLVKSLYATAVSSLAVDGIALLYTFAPTEPLLACLYGGISFGATLGMLLRADAPGGGTELGARLLKFSIPHLPIGRICLIIDVVVIAAHAIVFGRIENALYSGLALYVATQAMDMVVYGGRAAKAAFVISGKHEQIKEKLLALEVGVTLLDAHGAFSGRENPVLLCAIRRREMVSVKRMVAEIDPNAFFIICDAHEVMGEGFSTNEVGGL